MANYDSELPIRSVAADNATRIADSSNTIIDPAQDVAQGSATAGEKGPLVQGAVTTAAPSYTTAQTSPLSLTTAGAVRVDGSATTQPISGTVTANAGTGTMSVNLAQVTGTATDVNTGNAGAGTQRVVLASDQPTINVSVSGSGGEKADYHTANLAANGTTSFSYSPSVTETCHMITVSGSGQLFITIAHGTTGAEATKFMAFTSKGDLNYVLNIPNGLTTTNTQSVKVSIKNEDKQAFDAFVTIWTK
jgi:hypothetical protein